MTDAGTDAAVPPWPDAPFVADDLEGLFRPIDQATMLPGRAYVDPRVFDFERRYWFERDWLCVGREDAAAEPGAWFVAPVGGAGVIVLRGDDGELRAFQNVCRHRGVRLLDGERGTLEGASRIRCPYHAWSYDLRGRLRSAPHTDALPGFVLAENGLTPVPMARFGGFVFVSLDAGVQPLGHWLDDLPAQFDGIAIDTLRVARRSRREVRANWKCILENFAESDHFATVHPQLERLTPARDAVTLPSRGPWQGGFMPLAPSRETLSLDGLRHGRPLLRTAGEHFHGVFDYLLFPNLFLSLQPDYLLAYTLFPTAADRTTVHIDVLFHPDAVAKPWFDATDVFEFWALADQQDFAICERQQAGFAIPGYRAGRYTPVEIGVHEFDKIVASRYLDP